MQHSIFFLTLLFLPKKFQSQKLNICTVLRCQIKKNLQLSINSELECVLSRFIFKFILVSYHCSLQIWPLVSKASTHMAWLSKEPIRKERGGKGRKEIPLLFSCFFIEPSLHSLAISLKEDYKSPFPECVLNGKELQTWRVSERSLLWSEFSHAALWNPLLGQVAGPPHTISYY